MRLSPTAVLALCLGLASGARPQTGQELDPQTIRERIELAKQRQLAGTDLPVVDGIRNPARVLPPQPPEREMRSRRFAKSGRRALTSLGVAGEPVLDVMTHVDTIGTPHAFPTAKSDAVIKGVVRRAQAFLSQDATGVYSEFDVEVDTVIQQSASRSIEPGGTVTVLRYGGAISLPTGLVRVRDADETMPLLGGTYVLFLKQYSSSDSALMLMTGYRLEAGKVAPLDIRGDAYRFEGANESDFIAALTGSRP